MRAAAFIALALLADPILAASIHHGSLDNGLGVVIVEDHSTQLVGIHLAVKVSMQQEPAGLRGVRALIQRQIGTQIRSRAASDPALAPLNVSLHRTDAPAMVNLRLSRLGHRQERCPYRAKASGCQRGSRSLLPVSCGHVRRRSGSADDPWRRNNRGRHLRPAI